MNDTASTDAAPRSKRIASLLADARRKLLDLGTRNRLVHVNRANKRANAIHIINERSDDVFRLLRVEGRKLKFKATGKDRDVDGEHDDSPVLQIEASGVAEPFDEARYVDQYLETPLGPDAQQKRLLRIALDAKTAEEEQGVNILYLALGFLTWFGDPKSSVKREAPLILLPVDLIRNARTSTYDIRFREDEISTNLPLQERFLQDFGIALPEIVDEGEWSPSAYFERVAEVVAGRTGWTIDANAILLGFFSFAKLLMLRDLAPESWPGATLLESALVRGLLTEGFATDRPLFGPNDRLDQLLDPAKIIQVVDADASQTKVIEEVRNGSNLVVQGPPGTGKSQTITNIIAAAVHDGKSVLFVAEKMVALSVVHDRLVRAGLRDVCVELHSKTANKKAFAKELGRTLAASQRAPVAPADPSALRKSRDALNSVEVLLHEPLGESGYTPFQAVAEIVKFIGSGTRPASIPQQGLALLSNEDRARIGSTISKYVAALQAAGGCVAEHPFVGVGALNLQPTDLQRLGPELDAAARALQAVITQMQAACEVLGLPVPETLDEVVSCQPLLLALANAPHGAAQYIAALFDRASDSRLVEALIAGIDWQQAKAALEPVFTESAWGAPVASLRAAVARGQSSWFARLGSAYRRAGIELGGWLRCALPKAPSERLALIDQLSALQHKYALLAGEAQWLQPTLGEHWRGERTDFAQALAIATWLRDVRATGVIGSAAQLMHALYTIANPTALLGEIARLTNSAYADVNQPLARLSYDLPRLGLGQTVGSAPMQALCDHITRMRHELQRYAEWAHLGTCWSALVREGLSTLADAISTGAIDATQAEAEFAYACAEARWQFALKHRPALAELRSLDRHEMVEEFRGLEQRRMNEVQSLILSRHFEQIPRGGTGEMGVIRGEIGRNRGNKPIRWVIGNAGSMVQRIKPVFLMSPISIAQFLPPGSVVFDLLVIDEASQVRPEEALGAIARARQIVVVGDQKQLPPTSFFNRLTGDADLPDEDAADPEEVQGAAATEMESILTLCEARGLRQRMLEWHYRSRDPSLIWVSNVEFYENNLVLPPSPLQLDDNYGIKFRRVQGVYSSKSKGGGRAGTNKIEAQAVVEAMAKHARDWPELSLGVVTFSKAQKDMMTEVLEHARRSDPVLDALLQENKIENVFVKNIETVQGDERDVILISVGYGPHVPGVRRPDLTFGPINREGGARRLNVLFSRARVRCEVFASFDPGDIEPDRARRDGPRVLRRFLEFAKTGIVDERIPTGLQADSPFEEDVARVIADLGYEVDTQVGSAGFRIDLGVRHADKPGQYILAVECDGATYHSALWARERDRLRQDILTGLGWRFHRIWSTDWFHHGPREVERLRAALEAAREAAREGIEVRGANHDHLVDGDLEAQADADDPAAEVIEIGAIQITVPAYQQAKLAVRSNVEPHAAPSHQLETLVTQIVDIEGPIHTEEVARRVASAFGKQRTGVRIVNATREALHRAARDSRGRLRRDGDFWMNAQQSAAPPVRDRSGEAGTLLRVTTISPMEFRAAIALIEKESGETNTDDMIRAVARLLGFRRVGSEIRTAIEGAMQGGRVPSSSSD